MALDESAYWSRISISARAGVTKGKIVRAVIRANLMDMLRSCLFGLNVVNVKIVFRRKVVGRELAQTWE